MTLHLLAPPPLADDRPTVRLERIETRADIEPDEDTDEVTLRRFRLGRWWFIRIYPRAIIHVTRNGVTREYRIDGEGQYVASDWGRDYIDSVYADQKLDLLADLETFADCRLVK